MHKRVNLNFLLHEIKAVLVMFLLKDVNLSDTYFYFYLSEPPEHFWAFLKYHKKKLNKHIVRQTASDFYNQF